MERSRSERCRGGSFPNLLGRAEEAALGLATPRAGVGHATGPLWAVTFTWSGLVYGGVRVGGPSLRYSMSWAGEPHDSKQPSPLAVPQFPCL